MPLSAGQVLGRYEILSVLESGALGQVYKAKDKPLNRQVALRIITAGDEPSLRRFLQQARQASELDHPNIVAIRDSGSENGAVYIVTELVPGAPLERIVPQGGLPAAELLSYAAQAAAGLAAAHGAGVVHGNVNPANLLIAPDGVARVAGFGCRGDGPAYPAPEQAEGDAPGERSDVYSLGSTIYYMATGQAPPLDDPPPIDELRRDLPPEITRVIHRCLRADPARRFQHMADLKVALEELKEDSDSGKLGLPRKSRFKPWHGVALGAVLAGACFALWDWSSGGDPGDAVQAFAITSYSGHETHPRFSPDGSQVVFSWNGEKQENWDIYVKPVGAGLPLRLTTNVAADLAPAWSPDGKTIAFLRRFEGGRLVIFLIAPNGHQQRRLAEFSRRVAASDPSLSWSPDSKWLFVSIQRGPEHPLTIVRVSADNGAVRQVTEPPRPGEGDSYPAVSPDGRTLAFLRAAGMNLPELTLLSLNERYEPDGPPRKVNTGDLAARSVAWMPDGRELLFSAGDALTSRIYRVGVHGSEIGLVTAAGFGAGSPAVSSANHRLAFVLQLQDTNVWRTALDDQSVPEKLLASTYREVFPEFSPDGQRISLHSNRSGTVQVWICDASGSRCSMLTGLRGPMAGNARWSPDGARLCFASNTGGNWQIYQISAGGGQPRQLTDDPFTNQMPSWSRDGRWIYFSSRRSGEMQVWKIPSEGGAAVRVTQDGGQSPVESHDGRTLYFTREDGAGGLWRMPVAGGEGVRLLPAVYRSNYAVSNRGVYFTPPPDRLGASSIKYLAFATKEITELALIEKPLDLGMALSPDGLFILHAQIDYRGSDVMLVENFR